MSGRGINPLWFAYEGGWEWWGVLGFCQRVALSGVILSGRHSGTCTCTRALGRLKCHRRFECRGSGGDGNGDYDEIVRRTLQDVLGLAVKVDWIVIVSSQRIFCLIEVASVLEGSC